MPLSAWARLVGALLMRFQRTAVPACPELCVRVLLLTKPLILLVCVVCISTSHRPPRPSRAPVPEDLPCQLSPMRRSDRGATLRGLYEQHVGCLQERRRAVPTLCRRGRRGVLVRCATPPYPTAPPRPVLCPSPSLSLLELAAMFCNWGDRSRRTEGTPCRTNEVDSTTSMMELLAQGSLHTSLPTVICSSNRRQRVKHQRS